MKFNKLHITIFLFVLPIFGFGQFTIKVITNKQPLYKTDGDTLSTCKDTLVIFKVETRNGKDTIINADYFWDFDDENITSGIDLDSVSHSYTESGGYRVKLVVRKDGFEQKKIIPIRIANDPDFSYTKTDIPQEHDGICIGSPVEITGKAIPKEWKEDPKNEQIESPAKLIYSGGTYSSFFTFDEFPQKAVFKSGDIDSIGVELEHTNLGAVQIKIICPDGKELVFKDYGTNTAFLGEPIVSDNDSVGIPYKYYWTPKADLSMNSVTETTAPAGIYKPDNNFSVLNGCPMNGDWEIRISNNVEGKSGFISSWSLSFSEKAMPIVWKFTDTLTYIQYTYLDGENISATSAKADKDTIIGLAVARPIVYGKNEYTYNVMNNWNCPQDTIIEISVTRPEITANPSSGNAPLDVTFNCSTSWAELYIWELGRNDNPDTTQTVEYTYGEKGKYEVILTIIDRNNCKDTDTLELDVKVEPSSLDFSVNVFSPNGDGINDIYKLKDAKAMAEFKFTIFNRWGQRVYYTESTQEAVENGWDGKMTGTGFKASPGTYFFTIKAKGKDDKEYKESGTFEIFR